MKIFMASDHAGVQEKNALRDFLLEINPQIVLEDLGPQSSESVHYPNFAVALCQKLLQESDLEQTRGILICGTGIGMCIVANKFKGIRAALCRDVEEARLAREHNDSNVLCLGARTTSLETLKDIVQVWLTTPNLGGRHQERLKLFADLGGDIPAK